jgi:hypothetical protein
MVIGQALYAEAYFRVKQLVCHLVVAAILLRFKTLTTKLRVVADIYGLVIDYPERVLPVKLR